MPGIMTVETVIFVPNLSLALDELPELLNIIKGDMAVIGPRPQLVRDMAFMTERQRRRHDVRPGLSGLAQIRGRNAMSWEVKLETDLEYINNISLFGDIMIIITTFSKVFKREGITEDGEATAQDLGDYLLSKELINEADYDEKQGIAKALLDGSLYNKEKVSV